MMPFEESRSSAAAASRVTMKMVRRWVSEGRKIPMLTCYDATTARVLSEAGVPLLLVGDSAAQVILGFDQSIFAPLEFMLTITAAVRRGAPNCLVMGDMPFMSYHASDEEAVRNAGRFLTEGLADVVKLEVDDQYVDLVKKLSRAGVPVVAHIGWRPQRARIEGIRTAKVAGRTKREVEALVAMGLGMEDAGAVMLLIEQCTAEVSEQLVSRTGIPVIGCGAGPACHGHVVVLQDLLGLSERSPSFIKPVSDLAGQVRDAAKQWCEMVESGRYLREDHPYRMSNGGG